jgi:hypothetical protein
MVALLVLAHGGTVMTATGSWRSDPCDVYRIPVPTTMAPCEQPVMNVPSSVQCAQLLAAVPKAALFQDRRSPARIVDD